MIPEGAELLSGLNKRIAVFESLNSLLGTYEVVLMHLVSGETGNSLLGFFEFGEVGVIEIVTGACVGETKCLERVIGVDRGQSGGGRVACAVNHVSVNGYRG
jgi:hypothetical protein